jgi:hypothetical protein
MPKYSKSQKMKEGSKHNGLTAKQTANLPPALKKAILEKMKGKS